MEGTGEREATREGRTAGVRGMREGRRKGREKKKRRRTYREAMKLLSRMSQMNDKVHGLIRRVENGKIREKTDRERESTGNMRAM